MDEKAFLGVKRQICGTSFNKERNLTQGKETAGVVEIPTIAEMHIKEIKA